MTDICNPEFRCRVPENAVRLRTKTPWLSDFFAARNLKTREDVYAFMNPSWENLTDPFKLPDMMRMKDILEKIRADGGRAVVYGDYDVDGICASVIMKKTLCTMGIDTAIYIPDRHQEGYGLNADAVQALAKRAKLLVTVDCGITGIQEIRLAKQLGMTVIVTDHHTLPPIPDELEQDQSMSKTDKIRQILSADAVLSPLLMDVVQPYCGAGVAFQACRAMLGDNAAKDCLELVTLATIADLVPLIQDNRILVKYGLVEINKMPSTGISAAPSDGIRKKPHQGIKALISVSKITGTVTSEDVAFMLAPRLNASGRLKTAETARQLLETDDEEEARRLAAELAVLNDERKRLERDAQKAAEEQIAQMDLSKLYAIVVYCEQLESGVVGLAAGRIAEKYGYPTVILTNTADGKQAVGSARSVPDVDIYEALSSCRELFSHFGGHRQAAGMTLKSAGLVDKFRKKLSDAVKEQRNGKPLRPIREYDTEISLQDISEQMIATIEDLAPFGMGNPKPCFLLRGVTLLDKRAVGKDESHLKLKLQQGNRIVSGIAFRKAEQANRLSSTVDILFSPIENEFNGRVTLEARVSEICNAEDGHFPSAEK